MTKKTLKTFLLAFTITALVGTGTIVSAGNVIDDTLWETRNYDTQWDYEGYSVSRYDGDLYYEHVLGGESLREEGIFPLLHYTYDDSGDRQTANFTLLYTETMKMVETSYTLPEADVSFYIPYARAPNVIANTGRSLRSIEMIGNQIVVISYPDEGESFYLLDPLTLEATLLTNFDAFEEDKRLDIDDTYAVDNIVYIRGTDYATSEKNGATTSFTDAYDVCWGVNKNGDVESLETCPERELIDLDYTDYVSNGFHQTDQLGNLAIGQIGRGVYAKDEDGTLSRLGYGWGTSAGAQKWDRFQPFMPLTAGDNFVAWFGADASLYVAELNGEPLPDDGIQDLPLSTPFRTESDPTVYFIFLDHNYESRAFLNEQEYVDALADPTFSKVVVVADELLALHQESKTEWSLWHGSIYRPIDTIVSDSSESEPSYEKNTNYNGNYKPQDIYNPGFYSVMDDYRK
ncbi:MAG: hypothetical protein Q8P30_04610 [Candidatus Uhrbacteria bacterium]|nr:hypothetical protein [Candidatus Uhrbacteria bacterium]